MSITAELREKCDAGHLVLYRPFSPRIGIERNVYLLPFVSAQLDLNIEDELLGHRAEMIALLDRFVDGEPLYDAQLDILKPHSKSVWALKSRRPKPGMRLLGMFAQKDVFVGSHLSDRVSLGGFNTHSWRTALSNARQGYRTVCSFDPVKGGDRMNVISGVHSDE